MNMTEWAENEVKLACTGEPDDEVLDKYAESCYQSALKAFKSLCEDGHSGMSIGFTLSILNRMVKHKPLTPIEGKDDEWDEGLRGACNERTSYQNKRCTSLFKNIYDDGHTEYHDTNRTVVFYNGENNIAYNNGHVSRLIDKLHPITFPYMPEETAYKVYCNEYCNGDEDIEIREYTHTITPKGEREEINKYYMITLEEDIEITKEQFETKKAEWKQKGYVIP